MIGLIVAIVAAVLFGVLRHAFDVALWPAVAIYGLGMWVGMFIQAVRRDA